MYKKYKSGGDIYGCYTDMPAIIWQYFNVLETELMKREDEKQVMQQKNAEFSAKIMSGKNG